MRSSDQELKDNPQAIKPPFCLFDSFFLQGGCMEKKKRTLEQKDALRG